MGLEKLFQKRESEVVQSKPADPNVAIPSEESARYAGNSESGFKRSIINAWKRLTGGSMNSKGIAGFAVVGVIAVVGVVALLVNHFVLHLGGLLP